MDQIFQFDLADIMPEQNDALRNQGIIEGEPIPQRFHSIINEAFNIFRDSVKPQGIIKELSVREFEHVFEGEDKNADDNPLKYIFPKADYLALFALTMGGAVSIKIESLFNDNDFALASMLDSVASAAADKAVTVCEASFFNCISKRINSTADSFIMSYSPGYCGWHISGQKKLFKYLKPERINIKLTESCLMIPLKSVTGVLAAGKKEIHLFENNYPFCQSCKTRSCRERMERILSA